MREQAQSGMLSQTMISVFRYGFICSLLVGFLGLLQAQDNSADTFFQEGVAAFFEAKPKESVEAFDKLIAIAPDSAPQLWQRGLSLYYVEKFAEGRKQFELHQTVNPNDVENAAWHFICVAKAESLEAAQKALIPIEGDTRVPMKEVHDLFAGKGTAEAVMKAAEQGAAGSEALKNQLCYAHLYLGLYEEALGNKEQAKDHMLKAAVDYKMDHYMGKTAQVHVKLRGWEK
jgi:lipoprotein NlpI